ncbi:MAG: hypothetical protein QXJ17_08425 [Nitrososphaeria archaeon]
MKKVKITIAIKEDLLTQIDDLVRKRQAKELEEGVIKSNRSRVIEDLLEKAVLEKRIK